MTHHLFHFTVSKSILRSDANVSPSILLAVIIHTAVKLQRHQLQQITCKCGRVVDRRSRTKVAFFPRCGQLRRNF